MGNNGNINIHLDNGAIDDTPSKIRWAKQVFNLIANAKWKSIFKVYFVVVAFLATAIAGIFFYNAVQDKELVKKTAERIAIRQEEENLRDFVVTPKIQKELSVLVYSLNADRVALFEFHNGKTNPSGLPFRYADMSYEEVNEERKVDKIAMKCQNIPLTLYKFPNYLQKHKRLFMAIEQIEAVDNEYAEQIRNSGGQYLAFNYLSSNGTPLGFLIVSYFDKTRVPARDVLEKKLNEYDKVLTQLLDLQIQMELNHGV